MVPCALEWRVRMEFRGEGVDSAYNLPPLPLLMRSGCLFASRRKLVHHSFLLLLQCMRILGLCTVLLASGVELIMARAESSVVSSLF